MADVITPEEQALLDAISGPESRGSWNIIYGGHTFDDYSDHPRQYVTIKSGPNKGEKSSAAGKYQITAKTYDQVAPKLGITDFSPESQQQIALYLAREKYGPGLQTALENGQIGKVAKKLSGIWTSLPGGIEATTSTHHVASAYNRALSSVPTSALSAIDQIAPPLPRARPEPDIASAFASPAPLVPGGIRVASVFPNGQTIDASPPLPRARPDPMYGNPMTTRGTGQTILSPPGFGLEQPSPIMPPPMAQLDPLLAGGRLNASTGVSGGTNLFRGIPGINDATTIAPSVGTRAVPPAKVTFTGNGMNAQPTPFQQSNAAQVMAGLPFGIGTAAQGLGDLAGFVSSLGQAKAAPNAPTPSSPVPTQAQMQAIRAVPPQYATKSVQVLNPAYTAWQANPVAINKLQDIHDLRDDATMAASAPRMIAPPKFITQTIRTPIPAAATPLTAARPLMIAAPQAPAPAPAPNVTQNIDRFLSQQGQSTAGMTAGEQANAFKKSMGKLL